MGMVPPGTSSYNYLRAQLQKNVANTSGLQLTNLKTSDAQAICGRMIDSSVAVNGLGGIPITPETIVPSMLQGNAFPAPVFFPNTFEAETIVDVGNNSAGVVQSIYVKVGFANVPLNSAVKILWVYRNTLYSNAGLASDTGSNEGWISWAETTIPGLPYPPSAMTLAFNYGQVSMGISYDFGAAYVDAQGNIGAIGMFAMAYNPNSNIFTVNSSYQTTFGPNFTLPALSNCETSPALSPNGTNSAITLFFNITNQPVDGSLSRIGLWFRQTPPYVSGSSTEQGSLSTDLTLYPWSYYGGIPADGVGSPVSSLNAVGTYQFTFADLVNGVSYDFGVSCEDTSGGDSLIALANPATMNYNITGVPASELIIPLTAFPTYPANTWVGVNVAPGSAITEQIGPSGPTTSLPAGTSVVQQIGVQSWYATLSIDILVYFGEGGPQQDMNPSTWLGAVNILSKNLGLGQVVDSDNNANNYAGPSLHLPANTIVNPFTFTIGPFESNANYEIGVQLVDQAGQQSEVFPLQPFVFGEGQVYIAPGSIYSETGEILYPAVSSTVGGVVTSSNTLQSGIVNRSNIAGSSGQASGGNLIFNPTGANSLVAGTSDPNVINGWTYSFGKANALIFYGQTFGGGRIQGIYQANGNPQWVDSVMYQPLNNLYPGTTYTVSGQIEIDNASTSGCFAGVEIYQGTFNVSGGAIAGYAFTPGAGNTQPPTYFEFTFTAPLEGPLYIALHVGNNDTGGDINAYFYKIQLETGTQATPFQDDSAAAAVNNTHTYTGQLSLTSGTISGGAVPFNVQPGSVQNVINNSNFTYYPSQADTTPGQELPYVANSGAVQNATGSNGQITNGSFFSNSWSTPVSGLTFGPPGGSGETIPSGISTPSGGTWQFYYTFSATASSGGTVTLNFKNSSGSNPSGYSSAQNINTGITLVNGPNTIAATVICSGGQTVYLSFTSTENLSNGIFTVQAFQIA